jgi:acetyltransferase-like isoleucine patch superfamily enzyme
MRKLFNKILLFLGVRLYNLENKIASLTLPRFANNPANLKIMMPRRFDNPQHIYLGDNISLGPGSLLKTVTRYPGDSKMAREKGVSVQEFTPRLVIGNRVTATGNLQISALKEIIIEDDVMFASNIFICDAFHGYDNIDIPYKYQPMCKIAPIKIGMGCWIGQNVVIMPGVTIGQMSIIGANTVVTRSVPPRSIAIGNPARVTKEWDDKSSRWVAVDNNE